MNRRGFLAALVAVPVAGLVGLGAMKRRMTAAEIAAAVERLCYQHWKNAMIYGHSVMKIDWKPVVLDPDRVVSIEIGGLDPDIRFVGTSYRQPDPWRAILGRHSHP